VYYWSRNERQRERGRGIEGGREGEMEEGREGETEDRLQSHQVHLTVLQAHTCIQYIHENESNHSEMGPVRQNSIQRIVRSVHVCALYCAQLLHTTLHRTDLIISPLPSRQ